MIIYENDYDVNMSPALMYENIHDISTLLSLIEAGEIPSGTGQPFPVDFNIDKTDDSIQWSPYINYWEK